MTTQYQIGLCDNNTYCFTVKVAKIYIIDLFSLLGEWVFKLDFA